MTQTNFSKSLSLVLKSEGGNVDDPDDHGGRTSRGVTQREYDSWRSEKGLQHRDVWLASQDEIETIYHQEYWNPWCDGLPIGVDYLFFDMNVNAGPNRAVIILQRAVGVTDDGRMGPITRRAVAAVDPALLVRKYSDAKRAFYTSLHQPKYLKGWLNRTRDVQANAIAMVGR